MVRSSGQAVAIRGVVRNARGRAQDLLVVRLRRPGWGTIARTGWTPHGAKRQRGEFIVADVPAGTYQLEVSRFGEPGVRWTGEVAVTARDAKVVDLRVK